MLSRRPVMSGETPVRQPWRLIYAMTLLPAALLMGSQTASAQITVDNGCMQDLAGFNLNCTANDVQIAAARDIIELDDGCAFPGDTVDFTATFDVVVTAKERFDIGLYFATDGDPNNDGAISGQCSISTPPFAPDPPFLDLDGTNDDPNGVIQDTCGDIDKKHNPLMPTITLTGVACVDPDGDGKLNLPNCTSWRQSGANELCQGPLDAFPGSPSKCRCDIDFNIDIDVPPAELQVVKTATPTTVFEPGGNVVFSVTLTNPGVDPNNALTINSLVDDIYGDLNGQGDCVVPQMLAGNGGTYSCSFTESVAGNAGDLQTDTITAMGIDDNGNMLSGSDDATVDILDVLPTIAVVKTADPTEVLEPGGPVIFSVSVTNNSVSTDPVTIDSLTDTIHGNLNGQGDCSVPQVLAGNGGTYSCSFTADVVGNYMDSETDIVTASGTDDEGNPVSAADSATVIILNVPSMIELIKTANPTAVDEPGDDVTFSFTINNTSPVDTVTINSLMDTVYGDLNGQGDCAVPQVLGVGGSYSCSFTTFVAGSPGTPETNVATASGVDDDGEDVTAMDDATVNFNNVAPAATLTKDASMVVVTFDVTVTNDSDAEALTLDLLDDDMFGNITEVQGDIQSTTCAVPQTLEPSGELGDTYTCSFDAKVTTSPHTDTVTGTVSDDDGSTPITPSDDATVTFE